MAKEAPPSAACQLEMRHWRIIDEDGQHEPVDGPGVIGQALWGHGSPGSVTFLGSNSLGSYVCDLDIQALGVLGSGL